MSDSDFTSNMTKAAIRAHMVALRDAVSPEQRAEWSRIICEKAVTHPAYKEAKVVHCFLSMRSEIDTGNLIRHALINGKRVAIPRFVRNHEETPSLEITSLNDDDFTVSNFGLRVPKIKRPIAIDEIDFVLSPLLAFTHKISSLSLIEAQNNRSIIKDKYYRIGYGAGYYDRFLSRIRPTVARVGLAFALQEVDGFDVQAYDAPLDLVITERSPS